MTLAKYIVTSIDVKPVEGGDPNRVSFSGLTPGRKDDTDAVILGDVVDTGTVETGGPWYWRVTSPIYHATIITRDELKQKIMNDFKSIENDADKKIMLCVHGFDTQPDSWLQACSTYSGNYIAIPVIWPCGDSGLQGYVGERTTIAPGAASAFKTLLEPLKDPNIPVSIMLHSMGNYVLLRAVEAGIARDYFDNIFMVAADVSAAIFNKDSQSSPPIGAGIVNLLKGDGKVHVLYSSKDLAMVGRLFTNWFTTALGRGGCDLNQVDESLRDKIVNKDCDPFNVGFGVVAHSYQFQKDLVAYYEGRM